MGILEQTLSVDEPRTEYDGTYANSAWIIGACSEAIAERPVGEWTHLVDLPRWTALVVEKWGWSGRASEGFATLIRLRHPARTSEASASVPFPSTAAQYSSVTSSALVDVTEGMAELLKKALQAEEISIDVQAEIFAWWLIAQLNVTLRPLWSSAAAHLSTMSSRSGDLVWSLLFLELQEASASTEEERPWRDQSVHKVRVVLGRWMQHASAKRAIIKSQLTGDRFDATTHPTQLFSVLEACSYLAEKHNRDVIAYFLSLKFANPNALRCTETMRALTGRPSRPEGEPFAICLFLEGVSEKQQIEFLTLLGTRAHLASRLAALLETLLDLVAGAQASPAAEKATQEHEVAEEDDAVPEEEPEETEDLFPLIQDLSDDSSQQPYGKAYGLLSQLSKTPCSRPACADLVTAFQCLAAVQPSIDHHAPLLHTMNAYSVKPLEEFGFDRRLTAFSELNEPPCKTLSAHACLAIIYNMLSSSRSRRSWPIETVPPVH
ncbi:hypothetical protein L227DRAFT_608198 [Lentinus tigrinus ALCF2SS1-6]|uniref:U3 small nucleolar RNA-associated protein 20 N-terminal domain-containing protein n=1 Tax=Lentinus tigrinus ALCF2SS1-6 TaxID=1328759 RepID=A0A5C2SIP4_9APHY|nr:hypothetical protein L227DRAFT_608198 [Lentinus tigrinus ALCF2SS1-6]